MAKFGDRNFTLNDIKFVREEENIHKYCPLLRAASLIGSPSCRFKSNPLDEAGCALTNGLNVDFTKSKEVSNTINALHALGFVERDNKTSHLTHKGIIFADTEYNSAEMSRIIHDAVIKYGPVVGLLSQIPSRHEKGCRFNTNDLTIGYPDTNEVAYIDGNLVKISSGSKSDSNIRTKSCLLAWLTTAGYIRPVKITPDNGSFPHMRYRNYINGAIRGERLYEIVEFPELSETEHPLSYENLTKLNSGLRERGMKEIREATMRCESLIKNRRFAIIYLLNRAYYEQNELSFGLLVILFKERPDLFLVPQYGLEDVVEREIEVAVTSGIPFDRIISNGEIYLRPLVGLNKEEASIGAPTELIKFLDSVNI